MRRGLLGLLLCASCAGPPPAPPTAVIDATPPSICEGDSFATPIALSGARSAARLSLVPAPPDPDAPPLEFEWILEGAEHEVIDGDLESDALTVVTAGDRPLHVTLIVRDVEGGEAETLETIGLVRPIAPPCDGGCPSETECVVHAGESICVPSELCTSDEDCGCFACDPELSRCVPPEAP